MRLNSGGNLKDMPCNDHRATSHHILIDFRKCRISIRLEHHFQRRGDGTACRNYRGIKLLDVVAAAFAHRMFNRFLTARYAHIRSNQGGFRSGTGWIDHVFILWRILEQRYKFQCLTVVCFVCFCSVLPSGSLGIVGDDAC